MNSVLARLTMPETTNLPTLLREWREDAMNFLHHDLPKLVLVVVAAFVLIRLLRAATRKIAGLQEKKLPSGIRAKQVRTLAGVITSVGVSIILFVAALQTLSILGLNLGPLLASAGIAGLAIGFGAQTLVKDVINGFFILFEDQFSIGDTIRVAGVKGTVEAMSLRRTMLRDDDGTLHMVPNSEIQIVSNMTRDWAQFPLRVTVAYQEPSDRIVALLRQIGEQLRHDPAFADEIVADIQVPGIDRVGGGEAEYLVLVKTRPNKQYEVSRELRRRIKDCFQKNNIQAGAPGRVYVADAGSPAPKS
ncbi:MAG TPA: mechanosensitive ion channel family protein [Terriglobales bacterium]|jgi:small conductance mechanosensitive channel|nr:mechanosensitive ion channel family protein [Terriglobales bacterium]